MKVNLELTLNGQPKRLIAEADRTLLDVLREDLHLTGTKYGCGEGQCRACTVLMDGAPTMSCRTKITAADGRRIETIEGLATDGQLHPVQQAFVDAGAMQCGYCVPGMIMSTVALLKRNPNPTRSQIVQALNGNLCRCCGYDNILNAVERAVHSPKRTTSDTGGERSIKTESKEAK